MKFTTLLLAGLFGVSQAANKCGGVANYVPANKMSLIRILLSLAGTKSDKSVDFTSTTLFSATSKTAAIGTGVGQLTTGDVDNKFFDVATPGLGTVVDGTNQDETDCLNCIVTLTNALMKKIVSLDIPPHCYTKATGSGAWAQADAQVPEADCIDAMSSVIADFNSCTTVPADDVATGTAPGFTARCTAQSLYDFDTNFDVYRNLMSKALYDDYADTGFATALSALPCSNCFTTFVASVQAQKAALATSTVCGTTLSDLIYKAAGGECQDSGTPKVSAALTTLQTCLGSGFAINSHKITTTSAQQRCTAAEQGLITQAHMFKNLVGCSISATAAPSSNVGAFTTAFSTCISSGVPSFDAYMSGAAKLTCFACFGTLANAIRTNQIIANFGAENLGTYCTNPSAPNCLKMFGGLQLLNQFRQCTGVALQTDAGTCTTTFDALPVKVKSMIPLIQAARSVAMDSSISTLKARLAGGLARLTGETGSAASFTNLSCANCYSGVLSDLIIAMQVADVARDCADEFSSACLGKSSIIAAFAAFEACSGKALDRESPFKCTAEQGAKINSQIVPAVYSGVFGSSKTDAPTAASIQSTIAGLMTTIFGRDTDVPCSKCLNIIAGDLVALLDDTTVDIRAVCTSKAACVKNEKVMALLLKYLRCSGQQLDLEAIAASASDNTGSGSTDSGSGSTTTTTSSAGVMSVFASIAVLALSTFF